MGIPTPYGEPKIGSMGILYYQRGAPYHPSPIIHQSPAVGGTYTYTHCAGRRASSLRGAANRRGACGVALGDRPGPCDHCVGADVRGPGHLRMPARMPLPLFPGDMRTVAVFWHAQSCFFGRPRGGVRRRRSRPRGRLRARNGGGRPRPGSERAAAASSQRGLPEGGGLPQWPFPGEGCGPQGQGIAAAAIAADVASGADRDAPRPRRSAEVDAESASTATKVVAEAASTASEILAGAASTRSWPRLHPWWPMSWPRPRAR